MSGALEWDEVAARFAAAQNWWVSTSSSDAGPQAVPVWGVALDGLRQHHRHGVPGARTVGRQGTCLGGSLR